MKAIFLLILGLLGACNPFASYRPDSDTIQASLWAKSDLKKREPEVYCYRTLGECACYSTPQPHLQERCIAPQRGDLL